MSDATRTRQLVLLRHGKAAPSDTDDHERPLTDKGFTQAKAAGVWLATTNVAPQLTLCSTALRCRQTWHAVATELPDHPRTVHDDRIYEASPGQLIALLREIPDEIDTVLLVGHNPGMHALATILPTAADSDTRTRLSRTGFPPAAVAVLTLTTPWTAIEPTTADLVGFWTPHQ